MHAFSYHHHTTHTRSNHQRIFTPTTSHPHNRSRRNHNPTHVYTHLYYTGDATPGGNVEIKFVGLPGTSPVGLCIGTGVLDPPIPSIWGDWYLAFPIIGPIDLGKIPSPDGVLILPGTIPGSPPPPYSIPMQALIGGELSNLSVLVVK